MDSGGPGRMRGGLGQRIELSSATDEDIMLFLSVERIKNPAKGRFGGLEGAAGRVQIGDAGKDLPGKGEYRIRAGERLVFETPGGGGIGPPDERELNRIEADLREGAISMKAYRETYRKET